MLGILLGIIGCWIAVKLVVEIIRVSCGLMIFVGCALLIPLVIIGAFTSEIIGALGILILIVVFITVISTII